MGKTKFNDKIDEELLNNGFKYYDDWGYGPVSGWPIDHDICSLSLMKHDFGYDLIFGRHASGENLKIGLGSSNIAEDIISIRNSLKKLW